MSKSRHWMTKLHLQKNITSPVNVKINTENYKNLSPIVNVNRLQLLITKTQQLVPKQEIEETNKTTQPMKMEPISQQNVATQTDLAGQAEDIASSIDEYYSSRHSEKSAKPAKRRMPGWVQALLTIVLISTLWSCCNANYTEAMPRLHPVYYCSVPREKGVSQFKNMQQCNQNCHISQVQGLQHNLNSFTRPLASKVNEWTTNCMTSHKLLFVISTDFNLSTLLNPSC